ncbi:MAG: nuclear transport factor 2 family protein [Planktomarina sp.]
MQGFGPQYINLPDYILKCTAMIWERRGISELDWHYGDDLMVRTPMGINHGNGAGKANTMATLVEFPDRQLFGEDVIYSGDAEAGFLSSHRIVSTATHSGGAFGVASGKKLTFRTIADTYCKDNRVWDEWLIRDNAGIVLGLGQTPKDAARAMIVAGDTTMPLTPKTDIAGPYTSTGNDNEWGAQHADILNRMMNAEFSAIPQTYDRACELNYPQGITAHGTGAADAFWLGLRTSFPSATFVIDHQIGRDDAMMSPRSAIRWSLTGKHDGWGSFGKPTGADVHVMGVSHVEFGPWGLRREFTLFDEIAIWKQILLQTEGTA